MMLRMWRSGFIFFVANLLFFQLFSQTSIDHWEMAVVAENTWKYHVGTTAPPDTWMDRDFDDSSWSEGPGGFGYGDEDDGTVINSTRSVFLRINFSIQNLAEIERALLLADYDDAFVAYINGTEVGRSGISGTPPTYDQFAEAQHEAALYENLYPDEVPISKNQATTYFVDGENTMAVQVHNIDATSSDLSSNFFLALGLNVSSSNYQPLPSWFRAPADFNSSNLPIVKVNTSGNNIPDEPKITAHMGIIDNGPGNPNRVDDPFTGYDGKIGIEIRGSSSQMFPKKQYAVELWTDAGLDTSASVLGLPEEEDWILSAPYSDKSLLRNVLAFKFSSDLGWYAPRTKLVEFYLNEQYKGVYVFTEKIKRDKNRVNISNLNPEEISGDDLTGGYIVKIDKFDGATVGLGWDSPIYPQNRSNDQVIHFQYHYPKEDEITSEQQKYIKNHVSAFEQTLSGSSWKDPNVGYRNYINVGSFIDFAIINEITKNVDGYRLSTFLYKDKDSKDDKMYLGPVWDFNLGFGNADYCEGGTTQGWAWDFNERCNGDFWLVPFWWKRFLKDPQYKMQFKDRWTEVRSGVLSDETIMNYIDSVVAVLDAPQQRNFTQWPILSQYIWPNNYVGGSYANEVDYLKNWIGNRMSWLDSQIYAFELVTDLGEPLLSENNISVFPNPGNGNFSIKFDKIPAHSIQVSLHNQLGQELLNKTMDIHENTMTLSDLENQLPDGVYVMRISDDNNIVTTKKLIVYQ